jgi:valyl-tRNA synthetase
MSKSKGNVVDPLEVMERYGTDALRFTLAALAAQGRDIRLSNERIEGYRNFTNKLWNAARFVLSNLEGYRPALARKAPAPLAERWIRSRLMRTVGAVRKSLAAYRFNEAAGAIYQFWHEYCDWYLECRSSRSTGGTIRRPGSRAGDARRGPRDDARLFTSCPSSPRRSGTLPRGSWRAS